MNVVADVLPIGVTPTDGDRERMLVLIAERELSLLATLIGYLEIGDLPKNRASRGLEVIGAALALRRVELGLAPRRVAA